MKSEEKKMRDREMYGFGSPAAFRAVKEKKEFDRAWGSYLASFHWDVYAVLTFRWPVNQEDARREGVGFVEANIPGGLAPTCK
jgi:hypothetical protein